MAPQAAKRYLKFASPSYPALPSDDAREPRSSPRRPPTAVVVVAVVVVVVAVAVVGGGGYRPDQESGRLERSKVDSTVAVKK